MAVLSLVPSYDELRLTVLGAEIVLPSLTEDEQIILSCEISSLPTYNCNVVQQSEKISSGDTNIIKWYAGESFVVHTYSKSHTVMIMTMG